MGTHSMQTSTSRESENSLKMVDLIGCPDCGRTYLQKNVYRHLWNQHNWSREECKQLVTLIKSEKKVINGVNGFICEYCDVSFKNMQTMMRHRSVCTAAPPNIGQHDKDFAEIDRFLEDDEEVDEVSTMGPSSSNSIEESYQQSDVVYHNEDCVNEVEVYDTDTQTESPEPGMLSIAEAIENGKRPLLLSKYRTNSNICPECKTRTESCEDMVIHCQQHHGTATRKFKLEQKTFRTYADFKKWFDQRQEDSCTSLTKRTGHGGETFYRCHMIGKYSSVAKKRRANTRKLDQSCTAFLKVCVHTDGSTMACGSFDHIGHELNHKLLWLTETQENYVKELIDLGWSSDQIYFYIRGEYDNYESKLKYISKNDIRNITVRYERSKRKNMINGQRSSYNGQRAMFGNEGREQSNENLNGRAYIRNGPSSRDEAVESSIRPKKFVQYIDNESLEKSYESEDVKEEIRNVNRFYNARNMNRYYVNCLADEKKPRMTVNMVDSKKEEEDDDEDVDVDVEGDVEDDVVELREDSTVPSRNTPAEPSRSSLYSDSV